ncbi:hypothetical protein HPP92_002062 [Vanilla planifolia]|uniref:WEB family protein n=1 Tax=Vanilla planifolia TaxID=51239 RepID=A0A835S7T7_VANPL|nr:hypothetical protein HPP92_002062 [Vanilla planifolia]
MDSFAVTLIELTAEANKAKNELAVTRAELEKAKAEALNANGLLESTERKLMEALDGCDRLKFEYEDSAAAWKTKEEGFLSCIKVSEEEIAKEKEDNNRLNDAWKMAREENSRLRDGIKHAVNETTVVKEALETAQNENSLLKNQLHEKENTLRQLKHELESLKVSEAAALDSVRELKSLLASSSAVDSKNTRNLSEPGSLGLSKVKIPEARKSNKILSFERWKQDNHQVRRRHSVGEVGLLEGSSYAIGGSIRHKNRMFGSISNMSDMQVPSSLFGDERRSLNPSNSDRLEITPFNETVAANHKKKKTVLGRIGDVLRRRSFHR